MGDNDSYAFGLTDETINRGDQWSKCALCGSVRLWNVSGCVQCDRRAARRLIALALFVLALMAGAFGSALVITSRAELSAEPSPESAPMDLESSAEDWRSHFIESECARCPECCDR